MAQKRRSAGTGSRHDGHRNLWARFGAPAAFLLAATIAILLVRSGLEDAGDSKSPTTTIVKTATAKTTTKPKPKPKPSTGTGASAFYTVAAGDTFGTIASKNGITVTDVERLNPGVKSTSLFIGQKIRVK